MERSFGVALKLVGDAGHGESLKFSPPNFANKDVQWTAQNSR